MINDTIETPDVNGLTNVSWLVAAKRFSLEMGQIFNFNGHFISNLYQ